MFIGNLHVQEEGADEEKHMKGPGEEYCSLEEGGDGRALDSTKRYFERKMNRTW